MSVIFTANIKFLFRSGRETSNPKIASRIAIPTIFCVHAYHLTHTAILAIAIPGSQSYYPTIE